MGAILIAKRRKFHPQEPLKTNDAVAIGFLQFVHIWGREKAFGTDLFFCEKNVDRVSSLGVWPVQKHVDAFHVPEDEPSLGHGFLGAFEVSAAQEDIDILRIAHGRFVDFGNPRCHGMASDDGVGNPRSFEDGNGTPQAIAYFFHGGRHPFPGKFADFVSIHEFASVPMIVTKALHGGQYNLGRIKRTMPHLIYPIDAGFFHQRIRPTLAECRRKRSFEPGRELCRELLANVRAYHDDYHGLAGKTLVEHVVDGLSFDRQVWRAVVGEVLIFAAQELPLLRLAPDTLCCLLSEPAAQARGLKSPVQQVLHGSRDLIFAGGFYRPDFAGFNDVVDVVRLTEYLEKIDSDQWRPDDLAALPQFADEEDRAEEIDFVRENWPSLVAVYQKSRASECIVVCESDSEPAGPIVTSHWPLTTDH